MLTKALVVLPHIFGMFGHTLGVALAFALAFALALALALGGGAGTRSWKLYASASLLYVRRFVCWLLLCMLCRHETAL